MSNPATVMMLRVSEIKIPDNLLRAAKTGTAEYEALKANVKRNGFSNSIEVRAVPVADGVDYYLVDGMQRVSIAIALGIKEIPAVISELSDESAIIKSLSANLHKVKTRQAEYATSMKRYISLNPHKTKEEIAGEFSVTSAWLDTLLNLTNLTDSLKKDVDEGRLAPMKGIQISKLPPDEQEAWAIKAGTLAPTEFTSQIASRLKDIAEARKTGTKSEDAGVFKKNPVSRAGSDIKEMFEKASNDPEIIALLNREGATDPVSAFKLAFTWLFQMDSESLRIREENYNAKKAHNEEEAKRRKAERERLAAEEKARKDEAKMLAATM